MENIIIGIPLGILVFIIFPWKLANNLSLFISSNTPYISCKYFDFSSRGASIKKILGGLPPFLSIFQNLILVLQLDFEVHT